MTTPADITVGIQKSDVPAEVFKNFLTSLKAASISDEVAARFKKILLDDRAFNEAALKKAVFGEETLP